MKIGIVSVQNNKNAMESPYVGDMDVLLDHFGRLKLPLASSAIGHVIGIRLKHRVLARDMQIMLHCGCECGVDMVGEPEPFLVHHNNNNTTSIFRCNQDFVGVDLVRLNCPQSHQVCYDPGICLLSRTT